MSKIEELKSKVKKDYEALIEVELEKDKVGIVNNAYYIAHLNEVMDFVDNLDEEEEPFKEDVLDRMLNFEGNVLSHIWYDWLKYNHPENFNFFDWSYLVDIISYAFRKENC